MSEEAEPEPEQQPPAKLQTLGVDGAFSSTLTHHMILNRTDEDGPPTVLRGTSSYPGAEVQLVGFQYSGAHGPLPGNPYSAVVGEDGHWELALLPADGSALAPTGPCTLMLSLPEYGHKVTAYGCWVGDARCEAARAPCQDYGAPADHLYCPPSLRVPSSTVLRTAEEYKQRGGHLVTAPDHAHRTHPEDVDPLVATFDLLVSTEEAEAIVATAAPIMRRAGVTTDDGKSGRRSEGRTNDLAWLRHDENETVTRVVQRVADMIGLPAENAEKLQVIHYQEGQRYNRHADAYQPLSDRGKRAMGFAGNRMVTALFYLSDVAKGGGTGFSNLKMEIEPRCGKLLVFHNCYEGTCQVHPDSVHAGLPVVEGDKWAANLWFHERSMIQRG